jgi:hypothetical protein
VRNFRIWRFEIVFVAAKLRQRVRKRDIDIDITIESVVCSVQQSEAMGKRARAIVEQRRSSCEQ